MGRKHHWTLADCFGAGTRLTRVSLHRDYAIGMHTHDFVEINIVARGRGRHYLDNQAFKLKRGHTFVIPPHRSHSYTNDGNLDVWHLLVHPRLLEQNALTLRGLRGFLMFFTVEPYWRADTGFRYALSLDPNQLAGAGDLLEMIRTEVERHPDGSPAQEWLTLSFIALLCDWYAAAQAPEQPDPHPQVDALHAVFALIEQRYAEKLTLSDLARAAAMERSHFCRTFKQATDMTPMEHLNSVRVHNACRLIEAGDLTLTAIAQDVGFYDSSHFSRVFTRLVGIPPSRYRSRHGA